MVRAPMNPNIVYPWYQPFRASKDTLSAPVEFGISFIVDGVRYDYSIAFDKSHVVKESLYFSPKGKKAMVFSRSEQNFTFGRMAMRGLTTSSRMTSPSSSFLSVAAQFNNEVCLAAHLGIVRDIIIIGSNPAINLNRVIEHINVNPKSKAHMLKALRIADLGITNVSGTVKTRKAEELINQIPEQVIGLMMATGNTELAETVLYLEHDFRDSDVNKSAVLKFPFEIESNGTMQLFCLMGPIIDALENGYTIMIDEFGTFLHSDVAKWIIRQFRNAANPKKAQLLVNTQDQSLLSLELLRRDQIWFVQKDVNTGASEIYSLSDFNGVRADMDLQKGYSIDKFGAKPFVSNEDVMI